MVACVQPDDVGRSAMPTSPYAKSIRDTHFGDLGQNGPRIAHVCNPNDADVETHEGATMSKTNR